MAETTSSINTPTINEDEEAVMPSPDENEPMVVPPSLPNKRDKKTLSITSAKYDVNNKGYLDEQEQVLRDYDTNNDGKLDLMELKTIVADFQRTQKKETRWRTYSKFAGILLLISVLCNFAMCWVA